MHEAFDSELPSLRDDRDVVAQTAPSCSVANAHVCALSRELRKRCRSRDREARIRATKETEGSRLASPRLASERVIHAHTFDTRASVEEAHARDYNVTYRL